MAERTRGAFEGERSGGSKNDPGLPLIGAIDADRGRQIMEALTHLGGLSGVRAAIIDLTGIKTLDTAAAHALISATPLPSWIVTQGTGHRRAGSCT